MAFDGEKFGREMTEVVRSYVDQQTAPLLKRIDELETANKTSSPTNDEVKKMIADAAPEPPEIPELDMDKIGELICSEVGEAVKAIPAPQDGKSVTLADVEPMIAENVFAAVSEAVKAIPSPKDGVSVAGGIIDRDGNLIFTLSNGEAKNLGRVEGKEIDPADVAEMVAKAVDAIPKPKDGVNGLGFDDLDLVERDGGMFIEFKRGDDVKSFRLPIVTDRGVWKEGEYHKGEGVTWGGSFWIAQETTSDKPDSGKGWRLAVKKGRDGKAGKASTPKPQTPVKV